MNGTIMLTLVLFGVVGVVSAIWGAYDLGYTRGKRAGYRMGIAMALGNSKREER